VPLSRAMYSSWRLFPPATSLPKSAGCAAPHCLVYVGRRGRDRAGVRTAGQLVRVCPRFCFQMPESCQCGASVWLHPRTTGGEQTRHVAIVQNMAAIGDLEMDLGEVKPKCHGTALLHWYVLLDLRWQCGKKCYES
jgi:hypothetical protein